MDSVDQHGKLHRLHFAYPSESEEGNCGVLVRFDLQQKKTLAETLVTRDELLVAVVTKALAATILHLGWHEVGMSRLYGLTEPDAPVVTVNGAVEPDIVTPNVAAYSWNGLVLAALENAGDAAES